MNTLALSLALLAAIAAPASAQQFEIEVMTSDLQTGESVPSTQEAQHLRVLRAREVKRTFDLAASERGRHATELSCAPADSSWCANEVVAACDKAEGGMSANPDGGVTCSLPQHEERWLPRRSLRRLAPAR